METILVELRLEFLNKLDYLHLATSLSRLVCENIHHAELPAHFVDEVELAVSEACTNAIKHGADMERQVLTKVKIIFRVYETRLVIEVKDRGTGFQLNDIPVPDFDQHPESGYGIYIIQRMMDEVHHTQGDDYNTLTMTKYIREEARTP